MSIEESTLQSEWVAVPEEWTEQGNYYYFVVHQCETLLKTVVPTIAVLSNPWKVTWAYFLNTGILKQTKLLNIYYLNKYLSNKWPI